MYMAKKKHEVILPRVFFRKTSQNKCLDNQTYCIPTNT